MRRYTQREQSLRRLRMDRHVLTLEVDSKSDTSKNPKTWSSTSFGSTASVTLSSGPADNSVKSSCAGLRIRASLAPSAWSAASIGLGQSTTCWHAASPTFLALFPPLSRECSYGGGDIGGAGWASPADPGFDGVVAGNSRNGPIGAEACRGRCSGGEPSLLAVQLAEQARVRLGAGYGGSAGGGTTGETAAVGVVARGTCVDRVRWLAWWASCVDCVSSCGSTVPAAARVGEVGAGWEERGVGESMSLAVGYRGLRRAVCTGGLSGCSAVTSGVEGEIGRLSALALWMGTWVRMSSTQVRPMSLGELQARDNRSKGTRHFAWVGRRGECDARATKEVGRWFNIKIENVERLKGDRSWPSREQGWIAGFCRYLMRNATAEDGRDEKERCKMKCLDSSQLGYKHSNTSQLDEARRTSTRTRRESKMIVTNLL